METTKEMYLTLANGMQLPDGSRGGAPWRVQNERKVVGIGQLNHTPSCTP